MRVARDSIMVTDKFVTLNCPNLRRKTGVPGEKPSKPRRDQLRELSHKTTHTRLGFSGERHNALTASATRASSCVGKFQLFFTIAKLTLML